MNHSFTHYKNYQNKLAKIAIIGSGIVGQAAGKGLGAKGHQVVFCDINYEILEKLESQGYRVYPPHLLEQEEGIDAFFLSVSTPTVDNAIKLDFLKSALANLGTGYLKNKNSYCVVVIRSTVPPGTTEEQLIPILEKFSMKKAGADFGVCMNPEYLRENSNEEDFKNPWIIVIGELDGRSGDALEKIYGPHECPIIRTSLKEAEMQKYVHNLFNACKISFFNEMRTICDSAKVDADKVFELVAKSAEASWNPKYGIRNLGPYGGSCLPKDTTAFLSWARKTLTHPMPLLKAVIRVNEITKEKYNGLR